MVVKQDHGLKRGVNDPAVYGSVTDSDDIRRDIDQTRSEMDRTIDEFAERLQPRNLFDDAICAVRGSLFGSNDRPARVDSREVSDQVTAAASQAGRSLIEAVRENPVPAALMGAGLAWLLFEDKAERSYRRMRHDYNQKSYTDDRWRDPGTHSGSFVDARTGKPYGDSYGAGYRDYDFDGEPDETPAGLKDKAAGAAASVKHAASSVSESISNVAGTVGNVAGKVGDAAGKTARTARSAAGRTRDAASAAGRSARSASHAAGEYSRAAGSSMRQARSAMGDYSHTAADSMRHYGRTVSAGVGRGIDVSRERFDHALEEKPLVVGVAAIAAGLLAGLLLPHTRTEDRMYGRTSDRLKDEARRRGEEAYEEGKEVAMHVADAAVGDAESQGLTPGSLGEKVAKVAKHAVHAAKESAEREGIDSHSLGEKAKHVGDAIKQKGKEELGQKKSEVKESADRFEDSSSILSAESTGPSCGIGMGSTSGTKSVGGLSDAVSGNMSSVKQDADKKQDVAGGMSKASKKSKQGGTGGVS